MVLKMIKNYKIFISYDGSRYRGWQRQEGKDNTIQAKIENVLTELYGKRIVVDGSGRTDAGVHALAQVANFKADDAYSEEYILNYLNKYLPDDISVFEITEVSDRFHSRLNAKKKVYEYRILNSNISDVFKRKYQYRVEDNIDVEKMQMAAELFVGTHDFVGFSSLKKVKKSTVRTIFYVDVKKVGDEIIVEICGNGFLYNMVRIMVGTLLEIGMGKKIDILKILETGERPMAGKTLPPNGLCLKSVEY